MMYRQGDVLLRRVDTLKEGLAAVPSAPKVILAFGETTGHHHRFEDPNVVAFIKEGDDLMMAGGSKIENLPAAFVGEPTQVQAVTIPEGGAALVHEEHDAIQVAPGTYEVIRQREYVAPKVERQVID